MRLVEHIPHPKLTIQLFQWNDKYILKVEIGQFEQLYKVPMQEASGADTVKSAVTPQFLEQCMVNFLAMRKNWEEALNENKEK